MSAQVEELGENRVRLIVDVSPHELEHAVEHATNDLSESVKIPGFRKGKVPTPVLVSKIGQDRIWAEAVDSPHQRLVLVGGGTHAIASCVAPGVRLRVADDRQGGLVVLGHDRGAADA